MSFEKPMLGGCCVCLDERGWAENPLVYCDGQSCNVAVHQACYGIVKVPSGPWFCRKCESQERAAKVKCELCPHRDGALKRTDGGGWAHVVCALYIPEVTFGSVSSMEPIILQKVPPERFNKTCYICEEENRSSKASSGACMACAKQGCKSSFHVTCAQMTGLLCEEASAGNTTKYCGYCKTHLAKIKKASSSYKSLSSTKLYKLSTTSSSDEITSPDRLPMDTSMKPGDIRYTKAGKKRSRSLEDSLQVEQNETKAKDSESKLPESITNSEPALPASSIPSNTTVGMSEPPTVKVESCDSVVPSIPRERENSDYVRSNTTPQLPTSSPSSVSTYHLTSSYKSSVGFTGKTPGLTLSSLAEAASTLSHSSSVDTGLESSETINPAIKPSIDNSQKRNRVSSSKESGMKKKSKDNKKSSKMSKSKKEGSDSKSRSDPLGSKHHKKKLQSSKHNITPHRPIPPAQTSAAVPDFGAAVVPRHTVVSLANMGIDGMESYGPHEIGENNKIITPNFSVDGVTALERLLEEQKRDTMEFFREFGTTPDVAALMQTLHKVREENKQLQSAIEQMSHRRDQLLVIKARLSGLNSNNIQNAASAPMSNNNSIHQQVPLLHAPPAPSPITLAPTSIDSVSVPVYPVQQVMTYSNVPVYTSVTTK